MCVWGGGDIVVKPPRGDPWILGYGYAKSCLHFLGNLSRMPEDQLPGQLLVCAPAGGRHSAGGQKRRWNDIVASDLKKCNSSGIWREHAQERDCVCGLKLL